jgi:hypothetical protein
MKRIMMAVNLRCSCKGLFTKLDAPPAPRGYIFSLTLFTVNNLDNIETNAVVHRMNTRALQQLHRSAVNLSCTQKGVCYSNIKICNNLPPSPILKLKQGKPKLKAALRECIIAHTFYSLDKFPYTSQITFPLQHQYCHQQQ